MIQFWLGRLFELKPMLRKKLEDMMIEQEEGLTRLHNTKMRALEERYAAYNAAEDEKFKKAKAQLKGKGACAKKYDNLQSLWYKQLAYFRDLNIQNEDNEKTLRKAKQALIDTKVSHSSRFPY